MDRPHGPGPGDCAHRLALSIAASRPSRCARALGEASGADRPLGFAGPRAHPARRRLADEFGRRRSGDLVRCPAAARPGAAQSRPLRRVADATCGVGFRVDRHDRAPRRRRGSARYSAPRRHPAADVVLTMLARRTFLMAAPFVFSPAQAQSGIWPEWLGTYNGALAFYGSMPLEDIYPPPAHP